MYTHKFIKGSFKLLSISRDGRTGRYIDKNGNVKDFLRAYLVKS